jgi:hypothetical protein
MFGVQLQRPFHTLQLPDRILQGVAEQHPRIGRAWMFLQEARQLLAGRFEFALSKQFGGLLQRFWRGMCVGQEAMCSSATAAERH